MSLSDIMFMSTKERLSKPRLMLEGRGELWIELVLALCSKAVTEIYELMEN